MNSCELDAQLTRDLKLLNIPIDEVDLFIRPFSVTYFGRYFPSADDSVRPRVFLYPYSDKEGNMYPYRDILLTLIHEMVHHIQHTNCSFVRLKGVMHDTNFWKLYNRYVSKAEKYKLIGGETCEKKISC